MVYTAADLVILHSELDRIGDLVTGAIQENFRNVILRDILEARGEPADTLDSTLRKSAGCALRRLGRLRKSQGSAVNEPQPTQAPLVPPRTHGMQHQKSVHLALPASQIARTSLEGQQGYQLLSSSTPVRRCSAPQLQELEQRQQPPPSPLAYQHQSRQSSDQHPSMAPPNSKDIYSKVDKTVNKSQGQGVDKVNLAGYSDRVAVIVGSPGTNLPGQQKSAAIPFDPSHLPEPVYDPHDLEMFHQEEARSPDDPYYTSGPLSMLINPRSEEYDDFSGPNLDDHLTFRSNDSGSAHKALVHSGDGSICEEAVKQDNSEPHQPEHREDETSATCSTFVTVPQISRVKEAPPYEDVKLKGHPSSDVSGTVAQDPSFDSPPPSTGTQHSVPPVPQPRQKTTTGGGGKEASKSNQPASISERAPMPLPRTRSNQNLLAAKSSSTPPSSPSHRKPLVKPRTNSPKICKSMETADTVSSVTSDSSSMDNAPSFQSGQISEKLTAIATTSTATTTTTTADDITPHNITSIDSNGKSDLLSMPSEAQHSLESSSPHQSIESSPYVSNKSDPCTSTSPDNASPACAGDVHVSFTEISGGSLGSWVNVSIKPEEQQQLTSLDIVPSRSRDRTAAFSTKSEGKSEVPRGGESSIKLKDSSFEEKYMKGSTEIKDATPCWYCTNLTTNIICEICGNRKDEEPKGDKLHFSN